MAARMGVGWGLLLVALILAAGAACGRAMHMEEAAELREEVRFRVLLHPFP